MILNLLKKKSALEQYAQSAYEEAIPSLNSWNLD